MALVPKVMKENGNNFISSALQASPLNKGGVFFLIFSSVENIPVYGGLMMKLSVRFCLESIISLEFLDEY